MTSLSLADRVPIFVRKTKFRLPGNHKVPVIMVGPGTGIAPFRGFIQERLERLHTKSEPRESKGKSLLLSALSGCRQAGRPGNAVLWLPKAGAPLHVPHRA